MLQLKKFNPATIALVLFSFAFATSLSYKGGGQYISVVLICTLLAVPVLYYLWQQREFIRPQVIDFAVLVFASLPFISSLWSVHGDLTILSSVAFLAFGLAYAGMRLLAQAAPDYQFLLLRICRSFAALVVVFAVVVILDALISSKPRSGGLFFDANNAANILSYGFIFVLWYSMQTSNKCRLALIAVVVFFLALALLITESRSAFLAFCISLPVFLYMFSLKQRFKWQNIAVIIAAVGIAAISFFAFFNNTLLGRSSELGAELSSSGSGRYHMFKAALNIFADYPILGSGAQTFHVLYQSYRTEFFEKAHYTHNDYLQMLGEGGIIWLASLLAIGVISAWLLYKTLTNKPANSAKNGWQHQQWLILLVLGQWLMLSFLQALVYFVFYIPAMAILAAIAVAAIVNSSSIKVNLASNSQPYLNTASPNAASSTVKIYKIIALPVAALMLIYIYTNISFYRQQQPSFAHDKNLAQLAEYYHRQQLLLPHINNNKLQIARVYFLLAKQEQNPELKSKFLEYALANACENSAKQVYDTAVNLQLAEIYTLIEQDKMQLACQQQNVAQNSIAAYQRALAINPNDLGKVYDIVIAAYREMGEQQLLQQTIERKNASIDRYLLQVGLLMPAAAASGKQPALADKEHKTIDRDSIRVIDSIDTAPFFATIFKI